MVDEEHIIDVGDRFPSGIDRLVSPEGIEWLRAAAAARRGELIPAAGTRLGSPVGQPGHVSASR